MVSDDLRRLVERTFPDTFGEPDDTEAEFRRAIFETLEAGKSLAFLGKDHGRSPGEIAALKKIDEAYQTGVVPLSV